MIRCDVCGDYYPAEEMWIIGPFPLFTYLDSQICDGCFDPLIRFIDGFKIKLEFEEPYEDTIYFSNYAELREDLCNRSARVIWANERECPVCGGIMGEGWNEEWDCLSFTCLNCGNEILNYEVEINRR